MTQESMGTVIAALRRSHGMTQLELAEKMGVTDKAVSKWERDLACPDVASLPKLAEILGVSLDELMQAQRPVGSGERISIPTLAVLVLKAVALALGVGVAVLSFMGKLAPNDGFALLGIGLACSGIAQIASV